MFDLHFVGRISSIGGVHVRTSVDGKTTYPVVSFVVASDRRLSRKQRQNLKAGDPKPADFLLCTASGNWGATVYNYANYSDPQKMANPAVKNKLLSRLVEIKGRLETYSSPRVMVSTGAVDATGKPVCQEMTAPNNTAWVCRIDSISFLDKSPVNEGRVAQHPLMDYKGIVGVAQQGQSGIPLVPVSYPNGQQPPVVTAPPVASQPTQPTVPPVQQTVQQPVQTVQTVVQPTVPAGQQVDNNIPAVNPANVTTQNAPF